MIQNRQEGHLKALESVIVKKSNDHSNNKNKSILGHLVAFSAIS